jgi:hypothetical protein
MTWKQCTLPLSESCERIRVGFGLLAAASRDAPDVALFCRPTVDRCGHVLLLSPQAVALAGAALSARWTDCGDAESQEWELVAGGSAAGALLPQRRALFGRTPEAPRPAVSKA